MDILESGVIELIGINEQVSQDQFNASVAMVDWAGATPASRQRNGAIRSVGFFMNGAAKAISPAGELFFMDADPGTSSDDANLVAAEWLTVFGNVPLVNADVISAAANETGAIALYHDLYIPFHALDAIYMLFQLLSATQFNSLGGDDELLQVNVWYELHN